ncbi:MAG: hypothetical protein ACLFNN_02380 [Candidatus Paceibacterota bacterium]
MDSLLKSDIFFFVSTVALVVVSLIVVVALIYVVRILRNIFYVSDLVKKESDETVKDISGFRKALKEEGKKFKKDADEISGRAKKESEGVLTSLSSAHRAVKKEVGKFWGLFTFIISFLTINMVLKIFNSKSKNKKNGNKKERAK